MQLNVQKVFQATKPHVISQFFVLEEITNNRSTQYFGYYKSLFYCTYAYFSLDQLKELDKDFKLENFELQLGQTLLDLLGEDYENIFLHKNEQEARSEEYQFNLGLVYYFHGNKDSLENQITSVMEEYEKLSIEDKEKISENDFKKKNIMLWYEGKNNGRGKKDFFQKIINSPLQQLCISDIHQLKYNNPLKFDYKKSTNFIPMGDLVNNKKIINCKTIKEVVEEICEGKNIDKGSQKEMMSFLHENLIIESGTWFALNYSILNIIDFILHKCEIKRFYQMLKMIKLIESKKEVFHSRCFTHNQEPYFSSFNFNIDFLMTQVSFEKAMRMYNVEASYCALHARDIALMKSPVDIAKYKDAKSLFTDISKRISRANIPNFDFENKNDGYSTDLEKLKSYSFEEYSVEVVRDFNELYDVGMLLANCAGANYTMHFYKDSINYVLKKNGKVEFLTFIDKGTFRQLKGFKEKSPSKELFYDLLAFLEKNNFIKNINEHAILNIIKNKYPELNHMELLFQQECVKSEN